MIRGIFLSIFVHILSRSVGGASTHMEGVPGQGDPDCSHITGGSSVLYVSQAHGRDTSSCGPPLSPCGSVQHAADRAAPGSTLKLDGMIGTTAFYPLCPPSNRTSIKPLALVGYNGRPQVGCQQGRAILEVQETGSQNTCTFQVCNLQVTNCDLAFANCLIGIERSIFLNASLVSKVSCSNADVSISQTVWADTKDCNDVDSCMAMTRSTHANRIDCEQVRLQVSDSQFFQSGITVFSTKTTDIQVVDSNFTNDPQRLTFMGGLLFSFPSHNSSISLTGSRFENQIHPTKVQSTINLYEGAVRLRSQIKGNRLGNVSLKIQNCQFVNNERGLTLIGHFEEAEIHSCQFRNNIAMHAGAGLLQLSHNATNLKITNCTFINNHAGTFRKEYPVSEHEGEFLEVVTEMGQAAEVNSSCCKGSIILVGKGGGIRAQRGKATIVNSTFINNTATFQGGSILINSGCSVQILNTYFENTDSNVHSEEGDILYSDGSLTISDVQYMVRTARDNLLVLYHSGSYWSIAMTNFFFRCPPGFNFHGRNHSSYGVTDIGLRRSYKLDKVSYYCKACPVNTYSLDNGYLNYTLEHKSFAYFTLFINGSSPHPQHTGDYIHHQVQCENCPPGRRCQQGSISAAEAPSQCAVLVLLSYLLSLRVLPL